jgi:glutathione S-transferase
MVITLYGLGQSRSFRCLWALNEAKVSHDYVSLNLASTSNGGAKSAEYLKLNPQGKVPSLVDGGFVLTESAAILNYIDAVSEKSFIPTHPQARAKYDELAFFVLSELEQAIWTTGKHKFAIPKQHRVEAVLNTAIWEFEKAVNALSKLISFDEFVLGDSFSFADILIAQTFNWADSFGFDIPSNYLDHRDRMYSRSAAVISIAKLT